jgi:co-chaperonin GroES (HSP10)
MRPINKYILVDKIEEEVKTSSGLLLSAEDVEGFRYRKAQVVKPGTEVKDIHEGDVIYYDKRAGYTMLVEDKPVTVILERDVVVVL